MSHSGGRPGSKPEVLVMGPTLGIFPDETRPLSGHALRQRVQIPGASDGRQALVGSVGDRVLAPPRGEVDQRPEIGGAGELEGLDGVGATTLAPGSQDRIGIGEACGRTGAGCRDRRRDSRSGRTPSRAGPSPRACRGRRGGSWGWRRSGRDRSGRARRAAPGRGPRRGAARRGATRPTPASRRGRRRTRAARRRRSRRSSGRGRRTGRAAGSASRPGRRADRRTVGRRCRDRRSSSVGQEEVATLAREVRRHQQAGLVRGRGPAAYLQHVGHRHQPAHEAQHGRVDLGGGVVTLARWVDAHDGPLSPGLGDERVT